MVRHDGQPTPAASVAEARALCDAARHWWDTLDLPFETIQISDAGIQAMIASCVLRNIWQARDIIGGKPAFGGIRHGISQPFRGGRHVRCSKPPRCWGGAQESRNGIEYMLDHQEADGSFEIINRYFGVKGYWKENGIVLWAAFRHAQLSQDKNWLRTSCGQPSGESSRRYGDCGQRA